MNLNKLAKANELIDESIKLFKEALAQAKKGMDPLEIDEKYTSIARQKREEAMRILEL